jgi:class 3 adenylate cyclase
MRFAWVPVLVILLDQGAKWLLPLFGLHDGWQIAIANITLEFVPEKSTTTDIGTSAANNSSLILLASVLAIYVFITRWSRHFHFIADKAAIGLQLTGGGLTSQVIDLAFRGGTYSSFRLTVGDTFSINTGFSELALTAGFLLLVVALLRGSSKIQSKIKLAPANVTPLNFNILPRGIDNIHIDVYLSPRFKKNLTRFIHNLVPLVIQHLQQGKWQVSLPQNQLSVLKKEFDDLMNNALHRAKETGERQIPDILFIATLKHIHNEVNDTVSATLQKSKEGKKGHSIRGLKPKANDRLVAWLFRYRDHILALSNSTLLEALCKEQKKSLKEGVKNFLGKETIFSIQAMESPLVLSESPASELIQVENYLLFGQQQSDENSFVNIDKQLAEIFSDYLSLMEKRDDSSNRELYNLQRGGDINSNTIHSLSQPSVLMNAANIDILLNIEWSDERLKAVSAFSDIAKYRRLRQHRRFQRLLREKLESQLTKSGLAAWVVAAYEAKNIIQKSTSDISASQLTSLLARKQNKQEFRQKLAEITRGINNPPDTNTITLAWDRVQNKKDELLDSYLLQFIRDFSQYRRDLLTLLIYQHASSELNILEKEKDIETSRANFTLYSLLHRSEEQNVNAPILSHVIIKADLRGSTEVTAKLTELELNPATHFDRNFFSPINAVIESYGAEKVFIEGDAIILILCDRAGTSLERLIGARACGLAAKILQIVAKQNRELAAYGLPKLELGIGIAYEKGAPRYLFDGQHRITISPAINRADRLSACNWSIRNWRQAQNATSDYVEVYQPSESAVTHGEKAQKDMVFNLNGILIEEGVFQRITHELTPKKINNKLRGITESTLYAMQFPDLNGANHSLVIRKSPFHLYDPEYKVDECPAVENRYFYEVLHHRSILDQLRKKQ